MHKFNITFKSICTLCNYRAYFKSTIVYDICYGVFSKSVIESDESYEEI